jgi:aryl-alcohol dehydrogenase-like predicted oxidoreductase
MIKSAANAENTLLFCSKFTNQMHKPLGKTGLTVSACGFGAYRVDYRVKEHFNSMEYAITSGINLIDTSANYSDGGSEILIGNVLGDLINQNKITRGEIVVVSKGGYLQGKNLEAAKKMEEDGVGYKSVNKYTDTLWHCIHPDFLKDQITFSLERMKLEKIDVYLLHNPEYFLDSPAAKELEPEELRHEYYNRIKLAFMQLEEEVKKGRIGSYGISSNSFVKPSDDPIFTSLEECLKAANEISDDNNFKVIQFPLNLMERGAVVTKNQHGDTMTLLELASKNNMGTLVNRPLNALGEKGLTRLADFPVNEEYSRLEEAQIIAEINLLDSMEEDFMKEYLDILNLSEQNKQAVNYFMKAGQLLKENWKNFGSIESFNDVKKQFLIPRVNYAFTALVSTPNLTDEMKNKLDKIARQVNKLMGIMDSIYGLLANVRSKEIHDKLNEAVKDPANGFKELTLSQKTLLLINSLDEINCTLVGMRHEKYVDDVIKCLKQEKIANAGKTWEALNL